jgi:hypothetical protein
MTHEFDFVDQLQFSQGVSIASDVSSILLSGIPGAVAIHAAHEVNDRNGTDWWVEMRSGAFLSVDAKVRSQDYAPRGQDDLALETWSVMEAKKVGWTRDITKRTDYILWLWQDTGRWCLIPFQMLCGVFVDRWQEWAKSHQTAQQKTASLSGVGYHSQCVFVPRKDVWTALYRKYGGRL